MKTIIKLYTLLALAWLLPLGCSNDDTYIGEPVAVQFGTGEIHAKTTAGGTQWVAGDRIGVFMINSGQQLSTPSIAEGADNIQYQAQTGSNAVSKFTAVTNKIYYPVNNNKFDFIAYYPYQPTINYYAYHVDVSNQTIPANIDLLYSNNATAKDKNSGTVDLEFKHLLSKISFTLVPGNGAPNLAGATITVSKLQYTADFDLATGNALSFGSSTSTLTANTAADGLSSSLIVVPQTISYSKLTLTLADNVSKFEWDFPTSTKFLTGNNHQYTITVNKTGITVSLNSIIIWTGASDPATPGTTQRGYKIGDYYPDQNVKFSSPGIVLSGTMPIGVVFWVDPTTKHGKVVSLLENSSANWYTPTEIITGAQNMDNGRENMKTIYGLNSTFSDYPAFAWVHSLNASTENYNNTAATGIWYLPALNELNALHASYALNETTFTNKLTDAGGISFNLGFYDYYWASTEKSVSNAHCVFFDNGDNSTRLKNNFGHARAILAF